MGRDPDAADMEIWQGRLANGETVQSFQDLARQNADADRAARAATAQPAPMPVAAPVQSAPQPEDPRVAELDGYYRKYLGRPLDEGGKGYLNRGMSMDAIKNDIRNSNEAYVVRTIANYEGKSLEQAAQDRGAVGRFFDGNGNLTMSRQKVLEEVAINGAGSKQLRASYDDSQNETVKALWGQNFGQAAANSMSEEDKDIHGAALKAGMSTSDLNDYLKSAASGGVVSFTTDK